METGTITECTYEQTPTVAKLAEALAAAQGRIDNAAKDSKNPHFNSRYADLAGVRDVCREALSEAKIAVVQQVLTKAGDVGVRTMLVHASGEWMASIAWVRPRDAGPQALGSVVTYLRRYMLAAAVGIAQEDDDGNAGSGHRPSPTPTGRDPKEHQGPPADKGGTVSQITKADPGKVMLLQTELDRAGIGNLAADDKERTEQRLAWLSEALGAAIKTRKDVSNLTDEQLETAIGKARAAAKARQQAASAEAEKGKAS